jgi:hypothetical protein
MPVSNGIRVSEHSASGGAVSMLANSKVLDNDAVETLL